ncbi:MAG: ribosome small subunit-dependent GTPase A [Clostridia bacterium]|nr:ribosome small subunit-dependent GTPase A [Clostridia bacterium]
MSKISGLLTEGFGSFYTVEVDGKLYEARARGRLKKDGIRLLIGDRVTLEKEQDVYAITGIEERKNELIRPAVANVDSIVVVIAAASPDPNFKQTDKLLAFLEYHGLDVSICINKTDLADYEDIKETYEKAGYTVVLTSSESKNDELEELLKDKISAFAGCSGVGKSTLINAIDGDFDRETGSVGKIKRGRHTTTHTKLLPLKSGGYIADTPGFSVVDLTKIEANDLHLYFREFKAYEDKCKFYGCVHTSDKNCEVTRQVSLGNIAKSRYDSYLSLYEELNSLYKTYDRKDK